MPAGNIDDDDYVASLLKEEAKDSAKRYELVGIDAFKPKRSRSGAPKPNTNFLRHIIRQTDNHNAALLAREAEESQARLKKMERANKHQQSSGRGLRQRSTSRTPPVDDDERRRKRKRRHHSDDEDRANRRSSTQAGKSREDRESGRERSTRKREHHASDDERGHNDSKRSRHHHRRERRHRHEYSSEEEYGRSRRKERTERTHRRHRSHTRSRSRSRSRSLSPRKRRDKRSRHRSRSRSPKRRTERSRERPSHKVPNSDRKGSTYRSGSSASDSDPLEAIVGPLPPSEQPPLRTRGRGAHKAHSMGMDARFSSTYDPSADVQLTSDAEGNFGDSLEAFRDRQKWKKIGADRLREAGFTDAQVKKWERGDEKNEEDVVWTARGEKREWDRNKVIDDDGNTELKADFGRLT